MTELKPCPFCGGKAEAQYGWGDYNCHQIVCSNCGVMTGGSNTQEQAEEEWNRREEKQNAV